MNESEWPTPEGPFPFATFNACGSLQMAFGVKGKCDVQGRRQELRTARNGAHA